MVGVYSQAPQEVFIQQLHGSCNVLSTGITKHPMPKRCDLESWSDWLEIKKAFGSQTRSLKKQSDALGINFTTNYQLHDQLFVRCGLTRTVFFSGIKFGVGSRKSIFAMCTTCTVQKCGGMEFFISFVEGEDEEGRGGRGKHRTRIISVSSSLKCLQVLDTINNLINLC